MPPIKLPGERGLLIGCLTVGMLVVSAVGVFLYALSIDMLTASDTVVKTQRTISSLFKFRGTVKDLETEERGFIITGDPVYLEFYDKQRASIPGILESLEKSTKSQVEVLPFFKRAASSVVLRVDDLTQAIKIRRESGLEAAARFIQSNRGLKTMNELRQAVEEMLVYEHRSLQQANAQLIYKTRLYFVVFVMLGFCSVALFTGVAYFIRHYLRDINAANQKLLKHNMRLSEFYGVLAHELRTPMTSIRGALGLIKGRSANLLPDSSKKLVDIASDETERMLRLINELLDIEKIDSGAAPLKLTVADPARILRTTLQGMQGMAAQANVQLVDEVNASKPIECDVDRITQVLMNLISNAIKFSQPNNSVTVSIDISPDDEVKFSVKDAGPGIPEHQKHKVFQKFQQIENSKSTFKGTGLGLAISKSITEVHGGKIGFESEVGQGTTFWFALPQISADKAKAA